MSERFFKFAVETSAGSLSPRTNWKHLAAFELVLPPLDQQRHIAEILWAVDDYKLALESAHLDFRKAYDVSANERVADASYPLTKLGDLSRSKKLDIQTGPFGTVLQASSYVNEGTPIVNPVNMVQHRLCVEEGPFLDAKECERLSRYRMKADDILLSRKGDVGRAVLVAPKYEGFIVGSDLIRLRLFDADIQPDYLYFFLLAPRTRSWIARHASGTTMPGINEKLINDVQIPVPPRGEQMKIIRVFERLNQAEGTLLEAILASSNLLLSFANHLTNEL
jgi:type I restriction enzyme S subunit